MDLVEGTVDKPAEVQAHCSRYDKLEINKKGLILLFRPLLHVLAVEGGTVKDVTRRYTSNFHTEVASYCDICTSVGRRRRMLPSLYLSGAKVEN